jgi:hypothetical protein
MTPLRIAATSSVIAVIAVTLVLVINWRYSGGSHRAARPAEQITVPISPQIEQAYGIRFTNVVLTGSDGIIELRYRVLDGSKAAAVHDPKTLPYIVIDGKKLDTPAMAGHGHSKDSPDAGRAGYLLLSNTQHAAQPGDEVAVHMGDLHLDHVVVG